MLISVVFLINLLQIFHQKGGGGGWPGPLGPSPKSATDIRNLASVCLYMRSRYSDRDIDYWFPGWKKSHWLRFPRRIYKAIGSPEGYIEPLVPRMDEEPLVPRMEKEQHWLRFPRRIYRAIGSPEGYIEPLVTRVDEEPLVPRMNEEPLVPRMDEEPLIPRTDIGSLDE